MAGGVFSRRMSRCLNRFGQRQRGGRRKGRQTPGWVVSSSRSEVVSPPSLLPQRQSGHAGIWLKQMWREGAPSFPEAEFWRRDPGPPPLPVSAYRLVRSHLFPPHSFSVAKDKLHKLSILKQHRLAVFWLFRRLKPGAKGRAVFLPGGPGAGWKGVHVSAFSSRLRWQQ